jgi:hypothetical protein
MVTKNEGESIMSRTRICSLLAVALLGMAVSQLSLAGGRFRHGHSHGHSHGSVSFGFAFGGPWYYPGWYYPPYAYPYPYYYPPAAVRAEPTYYIERGDGGSAEPAERSSLDYWYYCAESKTYHPYVKQCPGGWQKQIPSPPPGG